MIQFGFFPQITLAKPMWVDDWEFLRNCCLVNLEENSGILLIEFNVDLLVIPIDKIVFHIFSTHFGSTNINFIKITKTDKYHKSIIFQNKKRH